MESWSQTLSFSTDPNGEEQLLDANGTQVMMEWERPYMVRCIDVLAIDSESHVLEVGFGCGYSAERIQRARPRSHTIIECAEAVLERLRPWAAARPGVKVCEGTWQRMLPTLGTFDMIFFGPLRCHLAPLSSPSLTWHPFVRR
jgi:protein-L-isoaspartate O-methyltransferase